MVLRGYDIDGVLTRKVEPVKPYVVISGRTLDEWERTVKEIGVGAPIYLRPYGQPGDRMLAGRWKAEMIERLDVKEFYEDDRVQAKIIQDNCPGCEVIFV